MNHIFCPVHWWVWSISEPPKAFLASVKSSLVRKGHSMSIWSSTWDKDLKSVLISDGKWMNMHVITMNKLDKCASPISKICHRCHSQVIFVVTRKALQHITDVSQKHASPEVLCNPLSAIPSDSLVPETCSLFATWLLETNLKTQIHWFGPSVLKKTQPAAGKPRVPGCHVDFHNDNFKNKTLQYTGFKI